MASNDDYVAVVQKIKRSLDKYRLAFKTYPISELDDLMQDKAGTGARVSSKSNSDIFENALLKGGLLVFPSIEEAKNGDNYVRIFRAGSVAANILQSYLNPGPTTDDSLASLLKSLRPE